MLKPVKTNYKTWTFTVKTAKTHWMCTSKKKKLLISDDKAKAKLKCAECLADRTFFDKINDEYDLEQLIKHFFRYWCL